MRTRTVVMFVAVLAMAGAAYADWTPEMPAKWVQMPDLQSGIDVNATWKQGVTGEPQFPFVKTLADDFLCKSVGPITDVHIWGSWLNDQINRNAIFKLSIHDDVPAPPVGYSHPGNLLWQQIFSPAQYLVRPWATATEMFWDPNTGQPLGGDTLVWQYNFYIPPTEAFVQQGTPEKPIVYWLDVMAIQPLVPGEIIDPTVFGWKTSINHWNDDAVFGDTYNPGAPPEYWRELIDPRTGQSLDMAFVITPEPATLSLLALGGLALLRRSRRK
ncbi:MAG: PEP-CTERM sorting domain-containing protein [Planctomycetota bacterium]|nr:PEP-CTERM sorting domain-containing protein [Planctomycetota bacterium]